MEGVNIFLWILSTFLVMVQGMESSPHWVYRLFDQSGRLLYVGLTTQPARRLARHRSSKAWWADVARVSWREYPCKLHGLGAEYWAIRRENPRYNRVGTVAFQRDASAAAKRIWAEKRAQSA